MVRCKHLDISLDSDLTWRPHVKIANGHARNRIRFFRTLSNGIPGCSSPVLSRTYTACVPPIHFISPPTLVTPTKKRKLHPLHNRRNSHQNDNRNVNRLLTFLSLDDVMSDLTCRNVAISRNRPVQTETTSTLNLPKPQSHRLLTVHPI